MKVNETEQWYKRREKELQATIDKMTSAWVEERENMHRVIESKNKDMQRYQMEMHDLLDAMTELQQQNQQQQQPSQRQPSFPIQSLQQSYMMNSTNHRGKFYWLLYFI